MAPMFRRATPTTPNGGSFSQSLRFELADEEGRALLVSHAISATIGFAFILLVHLSPRIERPIFKPGEPIPIGTTFRFQEIREPSEIAPTRNRSDRANARNPGNATLGGTVRNAAAAIGNAFRNAGSGIVGDTRNILGGVAVTRAGDGRVAAGRTVLAAGAGGMGSTLPTGGGMGSGGAGGAEIGSVNASGGLGRASVSVAAPLSVPLDALAPPTRNGGELRNYVGSREAQLRVCYERGLALNPRLAGSVTVAVEIAANGTVGSPRVARSTWSGAGVAEAEACLVNAIGSWRLPQAGGGAATYSFPLSFTR